ncbi:MAG: transketolase family protein [Spirochaetaceae bacterium]|nr:MAG: transketolase family protein [Spirochaetaceae bacterium]
MSEVKSLRVAYGEALVELGKKSDAVVTLEADLGKSTQSIMFGTEFPDRHFEMGIAEQNMASTAAGLALVGKIPFFNTFAIFAAGRAFDQVRNSICVPNLKVRICGSSAGLSDYGDGKTHQMIEDMALMRALPHMTVVCPCDAVEVKKMMACMLDWDGPVYIRINRNDLPVVYPEHEQYHIGKVTKMRDGADVAVFACGVMTAKALEAAEALEADGVSVKVLNVGTIKPLDREAIIEHASGVRAIVVAEEHTIIGGLGGAILEALRGVSHAPAEFVGVEDTFGASAENYDILMNHFGLTSDAIVSAVKKLLSA